MSEPAAIAVQLARQVSHWHDAANRLSRVEELADSDAWASLERETGVALRGNLNASHQMLMADAAKLEARLPNAGETPDLKRLASELVEFRKRYLQTETILYFYGDCVRARTSPRMAGLLRACDRLSAVSMSDVLEPLGRKTPPVLAYAEGGIGAAILKSRSLLWDGRTLSKVAAIKIARQNLLRPTNAVHETGHQVAHILGWTDDLAARIEADIPSQNATVWAGWASEMAADAFAFVHTGYASVAGLHDVVSGGPNFVFRYSPYDPHPISYLRVLLGIEMCRQAYGGGPWDNMAVAWKAMHPLALAPEKTAILIGNLSGDIPRIAELLINVPMDAFKGRSLSSLVNPEKVSPANLNELETRAGTALFTKPYWLRREPLRTLALNGLRLAVNPGESAAITARQESWMRRLGGVAEPETRAVHFKHSVAV